MLYEVLIIVYVIVALALIGLVLVQHGKGADMGASFGAGSSATVFGSSGSGNFLTKTTTYLAVAFFVISLVLGNLTNDRAKAPDEWQNLSESAQSTAADSAEPAKAPAVNEDVPASTEPEKTDNNSDIPN